MTTKVITDDTPSTSTSDLASCSEGHLKITPVQGRSDGRGYRDTLSQSASSSVTMQSAEANCCSYISNNVQDDPEEGEITEEAQRVKQEEDARMEAQPCLAEDTRMNACSAKQASDLFQGKTFFDGPHCQNGPVVTTIVLFRP